MEKLLARIESLEQQNAELNAKLENAYSINAREMSLEAESLRANLSKEFSWLHDDFMEYVTAENTIENYESLQAIIKKMFRVAERNGIIIK